MDVDNLLSTSMPSMSITICSLVFPRGKTRERRQMDCVREDNDLKPVKCETDSRAKGSETFKS